ncbi:hypothetical protein ACA910_016617 [Epithemia clementina (nom. ined.)]
MLSSPNSSLEREPLIAEDNDDLDSDMSDHHFHHHLERAQRESAIMRSHDVDDTEEDDYGDQSFDVTRPNALRSGPVEQWEADEREERRQVGGAAIAGGIAGLVLAGPVVGLLLAGGAAAIATTRGKAGDVTRATGEVMAQAGDRLKEIDQKHHFSEKASKGIAKSADWVSKKLKPKREQEQDAMYGLTA